MIIKGITDLALASDIAMAVEDCLNEDGVRISANMLSRVWETIYDTLKEKERWSEEYIA